MNKLFKSFMLISIVLLLPLSSMAEDRVRFSYRLGGSVSDPALGTKSVSYFKASTGSEKGTGEEKTDTVSYSAYSLHYISDYGLSFLGGGEILLGLFNYTKSYTTDIKTSTAWYHPQNQSQIVAASGTQLAQRKASGYLRCLDVGYVYPIGDMTIGGGMALPVLGSSADLKVEWNSTGASLAGWGAGASAQTEKLEPEGKSFSAYFINFGYGLGSFEIVGSYRAVTSKTEAALDTSKGVGAMISKDVLESSGTDTSMMLGFGYLF